jgi:Zn-dependent membrane protease YugP
MREGMTKMFGLDPLDFVWLAPGLVLALWAQWRMQQVYRQGKVVAPTRRITGAQAAAEVLQFAGITGVAIEPGKGMLTDHYDPRHKVLRLRLDVYYGQSLTALGLAAHEAGHALQDAVGYPLLGLRNGLVPLASLGSYISWFLILTGGILMVMQSLWGKPVLLLGLGAFSVTVLCQLIALPVEFDASTRARHLLVHAGMVTAAEAPVVQRVLQAAALTYVAASLTVLWTWLYCCIGAMLLEKSHSQ